MTSRKIGKMNEIMTQSFTDMSHLTPIEIALGVERDDHREEAV